MKKPNLNRPSNAHLVDSLVKASWKLNAVDKPCVVVSEHTGNTCPVTPGHYDIFQLRHNGIIAMYSKVNVMIGVYQVDMWVNNDTIKRIKSCK